MDCMQRRPVDCTCENANKGAAYARACVRLRMGMDAGWTCQRLASEGMIVLYLCALVGVRCRCKQLKHLRQMS